MTRITRTLAQHTVALCAAALSSIVPSRSQQPDAPNRAVTFCENRGQWHPQARFLARSGGLNTWLTRDGFVVQAERRDVDGTRGVAVHLVFEGAASEPVGAEPAAELGLRNYLLGNDRTRWATGVTSFRRVRYPDLHAGIDLVVRDQDGIVEYDLELAPDADPSRIVVRCEGHDELSIDVDGALLVHTSLGDLRQEPPQTWTYDSEGREREVGCRFVLPGGDRFGFEPIGWSRDARLVIDPGLIWSTTIGGDDLDDVLAVRSLANGEVLCAGTTESECNSRSRQGHTSPCTGTRSPTALTISSRNSAAMDRA